MKIIQMSDFHFNIDTNIDECKEKINKLFDAVAGKINIDEEVLFCICGDIVDKGDRRGYDKAEIAFDYLKSKFNGYKSSFEFTPGNHDLCEDNFIYFDMFTETYLDRTKYKYQDDNVIVREFDNLNLILINSIFHKDTKFGSLDIAKIKDIIPQNHKNTIMMTHHTIISEYNDDNSAIRNAYDLIGLIHEHKVTALLHGHTHGYSDISVAKDCKIIGVGPMFKKVDDINNQFNLITIVANKINEVINFRFSADLKKFDEVCAYSKKNENYFRGTEVSQVYSEVLESTRVYGCISNLNINITSTIDKFFVDIEKAFTPHIDIAKQWQANEVPKTLYYNHGMYMRKDDLIGLDYIVEELNKKATSSRAIIPLININDVIGSGDNFLPSLDIIQFGFFEENKTELHVTLYLRALEVNHFLKINLSEIYLMVKRLKQKILSIKKLNINVFAFRAQYKEYFSCFQKAEIDQLTEREIMLTVMKKDISRIIYLLNNKLELSETVVHTHGMEILYNCIKDYEIIEKEGYYIEDLMEKIQFLVESMIELQELRNLTSIYETIKGKEDAVRMQMETIICNFESMMGV